MQQLAQIGGETKPISRHLCMTSYCECLLFLSALLAFLSLKVQQLVLVTDKRRKLIVHFRQRDQSFTNYCAKMGTGGGRCVCVWVGVGGIPK